MFQAIKKFFTDIFDKSMRYQGLPVKGFTEAVKDGTIAIPTDAEDAFNALSIELDVKRREGYSTYIVGKEACADYAAWLPLRVGHKSEECKQLQETIAFLEKEIKSIAKSRTRENNSRRKELNKLVTSLSTQLHGWIAEKYEPKLETSSWVYSYTYANKDGDTAVSTPVRFLNTGGGIA